MEAVFVDTWAFVAQACRKDAWHAKAIEAFARLKHAGFLFATSTDVFDESVTGVHALLGHRAALKFVDDLLALSVAGHFDLLEVTPRRREAALALFRKLAPQTPRLSLTDCTSFALMKELGLRWALTGDQHFAAAGGGVRPLFVRQGARLVFQAQVLSR